MRVGDVPVALSGALFRPLVAPVTSAVFPERSMIRALSLPMSRRQVSAPALAVKAPHAAQ